MYVHIVGGTESYTTSTTNMYDKDRFHVPLTFWHAVQRCPQHTQRPQQMWPQRFGPVGRTNGRVWAVQSAKADERCSSGTQERWSAQKEQGNHRVGTVQSAKADEVFKWDATTVTNMTTMDHGKQKKQRQPCSSSVLFSSLSPRSLPAPSTLALTATTVPTNCTPAPRPPSPSRRRYWGGRGPPRRSAVSTP